MFARLTRREGQHGLLEDTATIGTRAGWEERLRAANLTIKGHRLIHRADRAPSRWDTS